VRRRSCRLHQRIDRSICRLSRIFICPRMRIGTSEEYKSQRPRARGSSYRSETASASRRRVRRVENVSIRRCATHPLTLFRTFFAGTKLAPPNLRVSNPTLFCPFIYSSRVWPAHGAISPFATDIPCASAVSISKF